MKSRKAAHKRKTTKAKREKDRLFNTKEGRAKQRKKIVNGSGGWTNQRG